MSITDLVEKLNTGNETAVTEPIPYCKCICTFYMREFGYRIRLLVLDNWAQKSADIMKRSFTKMKERRREPKKINKCCSRIRDGYIEYSLANNRPVIGNIPIDCREHFSLVVLFQYKLKTSLETKRFIFLNSICCSIVRVNTKIPGNSAASCFIAHFLKFHKIMFIN